MMLEERVKAYLFRLAAITSSNIPWHLMIFADGGKPSSLDGSKFGSVACVMTIMSSGCIEPVAIT
jgi:hypothetical protein